MHADERGVVRIGDARGKVAVYLDETGCYDLAACFRSDDLFVDELHKAAALAYPPPPRMDYDEARADVGLL